MRQGHSRLPKILLPASVLLAFTLLVGSAFAQAPPDPSQPRLDLVDGSDFATGAMWAIFQPIELDINENLLPPVTIQLPQGAGVGDVSPRTSGSGSIGYVGKGAGTGAIDAGASLILPSSGADPLPRILTPADVLGELERLRDELLAR
ncbi:MAG: hypothetical protein Q9Q40_05895 [Acidobacteriota bacterium]|nr:hypothetical protein [Acidobacteriota bacterium]MDQ7087667.1 hypothetical protein [Acidobacteriota bacterium]